MITEDEYNKWVNNEYYSWEESLKNIDLNNFKQDNIFKRMLGVSDSFKCFADILKDKNLPWNELEKLDKIGNPTNLVEINECEISGIGLRYIYYADKILNVLKNKKNLRIIEIGAGYGGLAANIFLLAKENKINIEKYAIFDLPQVQKFQERYLNGYFDTSKFKFLDSQSLLLENKYDYCISCYALGEFSSEIKQNYINKVVSKIPNGFILWNPHNKPDENGLNLLKEIKPKLTIIKEYPLTAEHNLEIQF